MANTLQTIRGKVPSKRVMLAVGGAAAIAFGAVQTADTMAADTDAASAKATQIASQNFFPAVAPTSPNYSSPSGGLCTPLKTDISWSAFTGTPAGQKYILEERKNSGTERVWTGSIDGTDVASTTMSYNGWTNSSGNSLNETREIRVFAVNPTTNERSTGYISFYIYRNSCGKYVVSDTEGRVNVTNWQDSTSWNPGTPEVVSESGTGPNLFSRTNVEETKEAEKPTEESAKPSETETAKPSEEPSETSKPSETETPDTSTPETTNPKPSTTEPSETETAPEITVSVGAAGAASGFTIYKDGVESCSNDKAPTDNVSVGNGEVTLTTADNAVKKVDPDTCKVS